MIPSISAQDRIFCLSFDNESECNTKPSGNILELKIVLAAVELPGDSLAASIGAFELDAAGLLGSIAAFINDFKLICRFVHI